MAVVLGVDGWRGAWVCAVWDDAAPEPLQRWETAPDASAVRVLARSCGAAAVGVDVPQGLPRTGARRADVEARALLGPRGSSVFPAPPRLALDAADHAEAVRRLRAEPPGTALSRQAFGLVGAVRDWDEQLTPAEQAVVAEVHPEVSFRLLAGLPLAGKRSALGVGQRLAALAAAVPDLAARLAAAPVGPALDDVLDATVAAWSAARFARGEHRTFPSEPERDPRGLLMRIVA